MTMSSFYSHAKYIPENGKLGTKKIFEHTFGVRDKAIRQLFHAVNFPSSEATGWEEFLSLVTLLHDLGKYTSFFQDYLLGRPHNRVLKQHARFGANVIWNLLQKDPDIAFVGYFIIKNHHRNLHTPTDCGQDKFLDKYGYLDVKEIFEKQKDNIWEHLGQVEKELGLSELSKMFELPEKRRFGIFVDEWTEERAAIHRYFFINYFFSLLIEGDKLDASDTTQYNKSELRSTAVAEFISRKKAVDNAHNRLRTDVRTEVINCLKEGDILERKLFMLTAPTGIGKTLTALDFAIQLRGMLPHRPQIITGLPFINIIEQTMDEYQKVLPEETGKVLGHYQYADIFGKKEEMKGGEGEEDSEEEYSHKRMELETWQADIVVTSFAQLLQTLISHKNRSLLKFNHFAGAIVIMDEVQSLKLEQVPIIGTVIYLMSELLGTRFILMTATKPLIFELAQKEILDRYLPEKKIEVIPLIKDPEYIFSQFCRTQIVPLLKEKLGDAKAFITVFSEKWQPGKSCLIVCNTVNRSIEVFNELNSWVNGNGHKNPMYYLSTNVLPIHRLGIIHDIKKDISDGKKPVLVSTQVVEAGVDLDFDMGFRDLGPIDSIIQVAGRINRENSPGRKYSPLYIIDFGDCQRIYKTIMETQARLALGHDPILEPDYYLLVETYFLKVAEKGAYSYSRKLFNGILKLQYDGNPLDDETMPINQFMVIEESNRVISVFVEWNEEATAAKQAYLAMLNEPDKTIARELKAKFDKHYKRTFHQHIVAVPFYYCEPLDWMDPTHPDVRIKIVEIKERQKWYSLPRGFNRHQAAIEKTTVTTLML